MKKILSVAALAAGLMTSTAVLAADYGTSMMAEPVMMTDPGFDWDRFYVGVFGLGQMAQFGGTYAAAGVAAGAIFSLTDDFKVNFEGSINGYTGSSSGWEAEFSTRLGYAIGDVMLYGLGGIGSDTGDGYFNYGAGVWFAATDDLSLRFEVDGMTYFGSSTVDVVSVGAGAFWHIE